MTAYLSPPAQFSFTRGTELWSRILASLKALIRTGSDDRRMTAFRPPPPARLPAQRRLRAQPEASDPAHPDQAGTAIINLAGCITRGQGSPRPSSPRVAAPGPGLGSVRPMPPEP
jgi:hypothetical protein